MIPQEDNPEPVEHRDDADECPNAGR